MTSDSPDLAVSPTSPRLGDRKAQHIRAPSVPDLVGKLVGTDRKSSEQQINFHGDAVGFQSPLQVLSLIPRAFQSNTIISLILE